MRKILWSLLGVLLLLTSCSNEDDFKNPSSQIKKTNHFCGVKISDEIRTKGVVQKDKLWYKGTSIKIKFLNGSEDYKQKVKTYAKEWEQYANIKFDFIESGDAHVRIGFDWNDDRYITWSYIGTDCKVVTDQSEATMSFADSKYISDEDFQAEVLRMFGMVLGLELEHRHINFNPEWRRDVSRYWTNEVLDIPWDDLAKYVFDPLEEANTLSTDQYDPLSIMVWPFPKSYLLDSEGNLGLSDMDKEFIAKTYPKDDLGEPILSFTVTFGESKYKSITTFYCEINSDIIIDWGNGNQSSVYTQGSGSEILTMDYSYSNLDEYTIKIYGDSKALKLVLFGGNDNIKHTNYLDISRNEAMMSFYFRAFNLDKIDVSKNKNLKVLSLENNKLNNIDISKNEVLEALILSKNNLESIDIVNNKLLRRVSINNNPIIENLENIQSCIHQLPDRTGEKRGTILENGVYQIYGEFIISEYPNIDLVKDEIEAKNWDLKISRN